MNKSQKNIQDLLDIMEQLRNPKTGCPWDLNQSFATIIPFTIEEVYEVVDAIERNDKIDLCEELGDLLFQIVFYAQLAKEEESFTFADVVSSVVTKMIRRHPHVFDHGSARTIGEIETNWQRIKKQEKIERQQRREAAGLSDDSPKGLLSSVKTSLPTYQQAIALQDKAAEVGFDWHDVSQIIAKIEEEKMELIEAITSHNSQEIEDEFGDLLFAILNLARRLKIDPRAALSRTNNKFRKRFAYIEKCLKSQGRNLSDSNLSEMESLWQQAKSELI